MKKTKILITGSTGNVGRILRKHLINKNYNVFCLTREGKRFADDISGDLSNYSSLVNATKNIDLVVHLAAVIKGNKKLLNKVNVRGTKNLIEACEKNKVKKIIFISSLDVRFKTDYGVSKLKAERIIKRSSLKYVILRPSAIYGEGFTTGINSLVKILKKSPIIPVLGSGKNLYQPVYVGDLISLIEQIINKNKFKNKTYFIAGNEAIDLNHLIDLISLNLRKKRIKIRLPIKPKSFSFNKTCSNKEVKKDFKFNPISIKEGIKRIL